MKAFSSNLSRSSTERRRSHGAAGGRVLRRGPPDDPPHRDGFEKAGRILTPPRSVLAEAREVLRRLQIDRGYNLAGNHSIVNDVLIALSARSIGATVMTQNERDYRAIQTVRPFELIVAS